MERIMKLVFDWYNSVAKQSRRKKIMLAFVPLYLPYVALGALYLVLRHNDVKRMGYLFLLVMNFASIWFILGPILMYNHVKMLKSFSSDTKYPKEINNCFQNNKRRYFFAFRKHLIIDSTVLLIVSLLAIIVYPEILSKNMTRGRGDWFFWVDIVFLAWMGIFSACAPAFISMFSLYVLKDIQNKDVFDYNPLDEKHRYTVDSIRAFCNRSIAYACSGIVFLPLAIYYIYQQPTMAISWGKTIDISFQTPNESNSVYVLWAVALLAVYAFSTIFFLLYPNVVLSKFIKKKHKEFIFMEQKKYIQSSGKGKATRKDKEGILAAAINQYNEYNRLQELKLLCKVPVKLDMNLVLTFFSILATILSAIGGILKILDA